jgi:hypothetical protein
VNTFEKKSEQLRYPTRISSKVLEEKKALNMIIVICHK